MKKYLTYLGSLVLATVFFACDENEIMPAYQKIGTVTATVATIEPSNDEPAKSETITLTLMFVSPSSDPLTQIALKVKVGAADYTDLQTFDVSSVGKDTQITQTVTYVVPETAGTVVFEMVISSQKEYPQVKRTSIVVQ
jgi:hypothetical protein